MVEDETSENKELKGKSLEGFTKEGTVEIRPKEFVSDTDEKTDPAKERSK